jgi:glycolate oxidase
MSEGGFIGRLRETVGSANVLTGGKAVEGCEVCGVVRPADAGETARVVALAGTEGKPVVARGGGTGHGGEAVPAVGGIVISTERMNAGPEIHGDDLYAVVGPGVISGMLRRRAEAAGLLYPIDPGSEATSTIGGNIAEGAAGMRGLKYGSMRNYVLGLELVTPEGKVVKVGGKTVKNVAGYDVTRLVVGSRGTLGIVTSATLKLLPLPQVRRVLAFAFTGGAGAAEAAGRIVAGGGNPAALEILDEVSLAAVAGCAGDGSLPGSGALLLVEVDGARSRCEAEAIELKDAVLKVHGAAVYADAAYPDAERLWVARRSVLAALASKAAGVRLWDVRLAPSRMAALMEQVGEVSERYDVRLAAFGHAGQGLLHLAAAGNWVDREEAARADFAVYRLESLGAPLGLGISERGGMGAGAWPASGPSLGRTEAEVVRRIKAAFDPAGVMNPGKDAEQ